MSFAAVHPNFHASVGMMLPGGGEVKIRPQGRHIPRRQPLVRLGAVAPFVYSVAYLRKTNE